METPLGCRPLFSQGFEVVLDEQALSRTRVGPTHDQIPGPTGIAEDAAAAVEDIPVEKAFLLSPGIRTNVPVVVDPSPLCEKVVMAFFKACDEACKEQRGRGGGGLASGVRRRHTGIRAIEQKLQRLRVPSRSLEFPRQVRIKGQNLLPSGNHGLDDALE